MLHRTYLIDILDCRISNLILQWNLSLDLTNNCSLPRFVALAVITKWMHNVMQSLSARAKIDICAKEDISVVQHYVHSILKISQPHEDLLLLSFKSVCNIIKKAWKILKNTNVLFNFKQIHEKAWFKTSEWES